MEKDSWTYSAIILLEEPHEDFVQFLRNLHRVFDAQGCPFEILIMANGTGSFLRDHIDEFQDLDHRLKAFEFHTPTTQAVCLKAGLQESTGEVLVVCGSYQQITNDSLLELLDSMDEETDIVSPWRQHRVDPSFNQLQSRVFNGIVRRITRTDLHDLSCTVKIFRREVLEETELYGNLYRFLPVLAAQKGFKTKEVNSEHYQERGKTGFYSLSAYAGRLIDMFTLYFNTRFTKKPLRFFSTIGVTFLLVGLIMVSYVFGQRLLLGYPVGGRTVLLLSILFMVLGVQTASIGLLGEILVFVHGRHRKEYSIEKTI